MINLNIDQPSEVVVTLYEKASNVVDPYFTWMIQSKTTLQQTVFFQLDHSTAPYYWNAFTVSVSTTQSGLTAGIINVDYGQYNYFVYEMTNPYDLNLNNAINLVEVGLMNIAGTYSEFVAFTQSIGYTYSAYTGLNRI